MATPTGQVLLRTCITHKGRPLEHYCEKCDLVLCLRCQSSNHKGHDVCKLSKKIPQFKQDIQNFIDKTEKDDLEQLRNYISSTDALLKNSSSNFEKSSYKNYKLELDMYNKRLKQQIKECKSALKHGSNVEIYDTAREMYSQITFPVKAVFNANSCIPITNHQHHLDLTFDDSVTSDPGQASTDQDRSVRTSGGPKPSSTSQQSEQKGKEAVAMYKLLPQTKVLEEWKSPVGTCIKCVCPTTGGQAWTSDNASKTLTLLDRKGTVIQQVKHKTYIRDISLSPITQTLWVCDTENNITELVSGQLTQRFSTKEAPRCICVTASNHVIVGMTKHISKVTTKGQMVLTTSTRGTGKPLVCSPWKISECPVTHNVAVVDGNSKLDGGDGECHVIIMDTNFMELFVCRNDSINSSTYGVVYDSVGNIIIRNYDCNGVLLISGGGEFLTFIYSHKYMHHLQAVGIDREDVLWTVVDEFVVRKVKLLQ